LDTVKFTSPGSLVARLLVQRSCSRVWAGMHERSIQNVTVREYGRSVETCELQMASGASDSFPVAFVYI